MFNFNNLNLLYLPFFSLRINCIIDIKKSPPKMNCYENGIFFLLKIKKAYLSSMVINPLSPHLYLISLPLYFKCFNSILQVFKFHTLSISILYFKHFNSILKAYLFHTLSISILDSKHFILKANISVSL